MRGLKGKGLLLILAIPFALYIAWQVNGVVRTDLIVSDAPADRGATKDQLSAARAKAAAWSAEARRASAVAWQYRPAGADDATPDEAAAGLVKAAALRSADLNDLDLFLSGVERPTYSGKLRDTYAKWTVEAGLAREDAKAVTEWLVKPPPVASATDARRAMEAAIALINQYSTRSRFADKAKAAGWRVRARLLIIDALTPVADAQYRAAVRVTLPLESGNNAVKTAVETLRALKAEIALLGADMKQADEDKVTLEATVLGAAEAKGAVADEFGAREELLTLFAKDDLFTNPAGTAAWLKQVAAQYRRTKDEKVRSLIRDKVQEFCEAFIPTATRLDAQVMFKKKPVPREKVVVEYEPIAGAEKDRVSLSQDIDGVNEFNVAKRYPGKTTEVRVNGVPGYTRDLEPTELSEIAVLYNAERKRLADGTTQPKWTAKSVEGLKKKCEAQKDLVDQLQLPGGGSGGKGPKIWTRLAALSDGMKGCADLFDGTP